MDKESKIYVAGHRGLVGSAILRTLQKLGYKNFVCRTRYEVDLIRQEKVEKFFDQERPEYVFLSAAKVGGIWANNAYPAEFIYNNIAMQTNIIHASYLFNVKKLLFLGSSCIYPRQCPQPMKESHLLSGYLESTNEPYAVAKIAGIKMCQSYNRQYGTSFICAMPTNLYGPYDNFDLKTAHVLPALIRKCHEAKVTGHKVVEIWGTGTPKREFLHVDDLSDACVYLMNYYSENEPINVGVGVDLTIQELAGLISTIVGFDGKLRFDTDKPDGTPVKRLDVSKLNTIGWEAKIPLKKGIEETYKWCLQNSVF